MGDNSKTMPIILTLIALLLGYAAYSGEGISMLGMPGHQAADGARRFAARFDQGACRRKIDTAKRDLAKESVEDVKKRVDGIPRLARAAAHAGARAARSQQHARRRQHALARARRADDRLPADRRRCRARRRSTPTRYEFVVVGHYHQVAEFLTDIASLRRIMVPGDVKLVAASQAQARAFGDTTAMLEAHFTVRTYVKSKAPEDSTHAKK